MPSHLWSSVGPVFLLVLTGFGIALGFAVNFSGLPVPATVATALTMITDSALPIALLGLGGVLALPGDRAAVNFEG